MKLPRLNSYRTDVFLANDGDTKCCCRQQNIFLAAPPSQIGWSTDSQNNCQSMPSRKLSINKKPSVPLAEYSCIRDILSAASCNTTCINCLKRQLDDFRCFNTAAPEHCRACARRMCAALPRQLAGGNEDGRCPSCHVRAGRGLDQAQ